MNRAHNLIVANSNLAPASKHFKGLEDFGNAFNPFLAHFSKGGSFPVDKN